EMLIEDMLELSRLQSNNVALEKSYVSIDEIIHEIYDEFQIRAEDLDITFNVPRDINDLPMIFANKYRIVQILVILLDNAFKFTPVEGVVGVVGIGIIEEEKLIRVSVYDTGVGIEEKDIPFVFERFYKTDKAHASMGTGIGLSIAYEIIKQLNESIYVESKVGEGCKFTFTITKI
ncbi:sensor histidine kinase, partial [Romboutsia sp.]|uniref:sensor histidine kinase n=1 Tax=Romboutsia sp. TaxID=1965302 RepID=UPI003F3801C9